MLYIPIDGGGLSNHSQIYFMVAQEMGKAGVKNGSE